MAEELVHCYNRGCGKKFDPLNNNEDDCVYHPEPPLFHDAYKIWPCCNKKSIDFSEFLSIKGCTKTVHSNEKPVEPAKPEPNNFKSDEVIEVRVQSITSGPEKRPPFNTPQTIMTPFVTAAVQQQIKELISSKAKPEEENTIKIGESCKHSSCKATCNGSESDKDICVHHPGVPIFHEGMKYWSCCQKKTSDFGVFLAQPGCTNGTHLWFSKDANKKKTQCRMDWHQTGKNVVISIYAKKYLPDSCTIKLSPVRLTAEIYFPEGDSKYNVDMELYKTINVDKSKINMYPSKIEIILIKNGPEHWHELEIPHTPQLINNINDKYEDDISVEVNSVDLSDL